jgi:serine-type D-Ala-D-Ala carboxypeptidase (penicillin-binding protein 5/6)
MKKTACCLVMFIICWVGQVQADVPPAPQLAVKAYLLKDFDGEKVLAENNSQSKVEPASLTKLMTAYLAFKAIHEGRLKSDQILPISLKAWHTEGSKMFVDTTMQVTVDELLHGMIIQSGNDASIALAEGIGGSEEDFAKLMNQEAARLGMKNTHFVNATGLPDPQHYTTASDLSRLAVALIRDYPEEYKRFYSVKSYTYNKITQPNRNRLLWMDSSVDGMKTGHTDSAGFCLISSAKRGAGRLISVVLGAQTDRARAEESLKLLNYGFQFYQSTLVYRQGQIIHQQRIWKGQDNEIPVAPAQDLVITAPYGDYAKMKARIVAIPGVVAPIHKGQAVAQLEFIKEGKIVEARPLVATKDVAEAGFFGRIFDSIRMVFY